MQPALSGILKSSQIKWSDPRRIGPPEPAPAQDGTDLAPSASARIIQQACGEALVEVVCPCGNVIHIQCTYAEPSAGAAAPLRKAGK